MCDDSPATPGTCMRCSPGRAADAGHTACDSCASGTFSVDGMKCKECGLGCTGNCPATTGCDSCAPGWELDEGCCGRCGNGTFSVDGAKCIDCTLGRGCDGCDASSGRCNSCGKGFFGANCTQHAESGSNATVVIDFGASPLDPSDVEKLTLELCKLLNMEPGQLQISTVVDSSGRVTSAAVSLWAGLAEELVDMLKQGGGEEGGVLGRASGVSLVRAEASGASSVNW